ncbi:MAG TPA: hypothetical protein VJI71_00085 [Candidatus Norongarragalinales archaeon]|nr:hypothetical protein [Candidatus Norongarragalinales archaeon]
MVDQQTVLLALIAVLVLVSAFQAFQLAELGGKVQVMGSGMMQGYYPPAQSGVQSQQSGGQQVQLPSGLANAPDMVGGC